MFYWVVVRLALHMAWNVRLFKEIMNRRRVEQRYASFIGCVLIEGKII